MNRKPEEARREEINVKDERLQAIHQRATYVVFYVTLGTLAAASFLFVVLDLLVPCFVTLGVMEIHVISYFVLLYRYNKVL